MALRKRFIKLIKLVFILTAVLLLAAVLLFVFNFDSAAEQYAAFDVKNAITDGINKIYYNQTKKYYDELKYAVTVNFGDNGKIGSISVNSSFLNLFSSEIVADSILFIENSSSSFGIPLGNITSARILSGLGPKIKVKIIPLGSVSGGIQSNFTEAGINQTLHRLTLNIKALIEVLSPFETCRAEINLIYVISETVIVGDIPNVYFR